MGSSPIWSMTACILSLITGGEDHGEFAGYRYGKDGTEHWKVAEAGRIVSKGSAGYFEAVNFSVSMEENPSDKIQICTVFCRIISLNLVSIYLSDYSITNLHGLIQECLIFCTKNKASRLLFSVGSAHTRPLE